MADVVKVVDETQDPDDHPEDEDDNPDPRTMWTSTQTSTLTRSSNPIPSGGAEEGFKGVQEILEDNSSVRRMKGLTGRFNL